jgi:GrpB-like predicted nucleotidyltransferase (UPF0157 family)
MRVEVQPYNPSWPSHFQTIKSELNDALQGVTVISIEHVGSTSVPGLAAKPVIDVDVVVSPLNLGAATEALVSRGGYANMGEWGIRGRVALRKADASPKRNVYVCLSGCVGLRNHIALRDTCRADAGVRDAYSEAKMKLAEREWESVDEYAVAKSEIVQWILGKAGMSAEDLREIASQNQG